MVDTSVVYDEIITLSNFTNSKTKKTEEKKTFKFKR